ncbi:MAG: membrane protein insertase YidC [Alphaproteobacteria bacterium]|nr:membrane protein insertase YidC [Alphaproteobacteria bacterium]
MKQPYNPHEIDDHRRLMLALIFSLTVIIGYQLFFDHKVEAEAIASTPAPAVELKAPGAEAETAPQTRESVIAAARRIPVRGERVSGTLSLQGLRLDDLRLNDQYVTVARERRVPLLNPAGTENAFYQESGWVASNGVTLPDANTVWQLAAGSASELVGGGAPVRLVWDNGAGLVFERDIALDENYLFTITQRVRNNTEKPVTLNPYYLTARRGLPFDYSGYFVLHEGPVAYMNRELFEPSYKDLSKGETIEKPSADGWVGITDKYWMVALLPSPDSVFNVRIVATGKDKDRFQTDIVNPAVDVAPGGMAEDTVRIFAGVKDVAVIQGYQEQYGYKMLDLAIDFGKLSFITRPFYSLFHFLVGQFHNIGLCVLLMTLLIRAAVFPLATKAYVSMAKMKKVAPQIKELQEKHKDDKAAMQMELMELYKRENANPFSGCWPLLIQIPIFFALYKVILISVDLRHAPFWGWIEDLSAPDPTSFVNLFGLMPFTPPDFLTIGAWPCLFCITMVMQKRLNPPMPDPVQEKVQGIFPYFLTLMMAHFASGLVIYWTWSNTLALLQQYYILRKLGGEEVSLIRGHHTRRKKSGQT